MAGKSFFGYEPQGTPARYAGSTRDFWSKPNKYGEYTQKTVSPDGTVTTSEPRSVVPAEKGKPVYTTVPVSEIPQQWLARGGKE